MYTLNERYKEVITRVISDYIKDLGNIQNPKKLKHSILHVKNSRYGSMSFCYEAFHHTWVRCVAFTVSIPDLCPLSYFDKKGRFLNSCEVPPRI